MMDQYITPERIANSLCQDVDFKGCAILVEGKKDRKLYGKFLNKDLVRIVETFGKYKQRAIYEILEQRGFDRKIGIRDADFLRIPENPKFDPNYSGGIFATDYHDSEIMAIKNGALSKFVSAVLDENIVQPFEVKIGKKFETIVLELAYILGCLKLANKRFELGLSFKPEKVDGNKLKLHKFICFKTATFLGANILVNTVFEYSKNRGQEVAKRDLIAEKLNYILAKNLPLLEVVNGHDACEIIFLLAHDGIKTNNKSIQNSDGIEDMLRLAFDFSDFSKTNLIGHMQEWQARTGIRIFD